MIVLTILVKSWCVNDVVFYIQEQIERDITALIHAECLYFMRFNFLFNFCLKKRFELIYNNGIQTIKHI